MIRSRSKRVTKVQQTVRIAAMEQQLQQLTQENTTLREALKATATPPPLPPLGGLQLVPSADSAQS